MSDKSFFSGTRKLAVLPSNNLIANQMVAQIQLLLFCNDVSLKFNLLARDLFLLFLCIEFDITAVLASIRKNSRRPSYAPKASASTPAKGSRQISYLQISATFRALRNFAFTHGSSYSDSTKLDMFFNPIFK